MPARFHYLVSIYLCAAFATCATATAQLAAKVPQGATTSLQTVPEIVDDVQLAQVVANARMAFLKAKPFDRCDVCVLVNEPEEGAWKRGQINGDNLTYPASAVKLAYLAAAAHWCRENKKPPNALDACVRPMIVNSDNVQTGVVVDAITQAPNIADMQTTADPRYPKWLEARRYTMRFLESQKLLNGQVLIHKTYPTNSGSDLAGAEKLARADAGKNTMQPAASAELILRMADGSLEPEATSYMRELLTHDRWSPAAATGPGFPPGTTYLNKGGWAYDNANDIAAVELTDGRKLVLSIFTNAYIQPYKGDPSPHEKTILAEFAELLLLELGWIPDADAAYFDTTGSTVEVNGAWQKVEAAGSAPASAPGAGQTALVKPTGNGSSAIRWKLAVPKSGLYEICAAYPQAADRTTSAGYAILHADGLTTVTANQRRVGGRWNRLGDFRFEAGQGSVVLTDATPDGGTVAAGALRALRWPD